MGNRKGYKNIENYEELMSMQDKDKWLMTSNEITFINQQIIQLYDLLESHELVH